MFNFIKVATATPKLEVANTKYNTKNIYNIIKEAYENNVKLIVFPELCITGYTCADLFTQEKLLSSALLELNDLLKKTAKLDIIYNVGLPLKINNKLYNTAFVCHKDKILGIVPKTYLPNYSEYYEKRWFTSSTDLYIKEINILNQIVPVGTNIIFKDLNNTDFTFSIEICEDLWAPIPPSSYHSLNGANIILNLSASNEMISKNKYRKDLVLQQSSRSICSYIYSSASHLESTTDLVYGGHCILAENGYILNEKEPFSRDTLCISEIDLDRIVHDRMKNTSFINQNSEYRYIDFDININDTTLTRYINKHPFVPSDKNSRDKRCKEIFNIQVHGLHKRYVHTRCKTAIIGISGGLDSTLALLVTVKTFDLLNIDRKNIIGITMPGFGTTDRTYNNSIELMTSLGVSIKEISIAPACLQHFKDIEHDISIHDVTYENTQARERTQILMDMSNKYNGLVIGTGDLSELALGFATYNGDHMSMYAVNVSIPKTLVRYLVSYVSDTVDEKSKKTLIDILNTPVSPELLPPDEAGNINQKTEDIVGPYELHDFFLYYILRYGFSPSKIYHLAQYCFNEYDDKTILKWLKVFIRRFFTQQFKRSCIPDGPKVGSICLSPRGDLRMPSDSSYQVFMDDLDNIEKNI